MSDLQDVTGQYDAYIGHTFAPEDEALRLAREDAKAAGLPPIHVSASEGKLLHVLATMMQPHRILEIGTLGGYSTIWLARALAPGGSLISLEIDPHHAETARRNIERAGLSDRVQIRVAPASESLAQLAAENPEPFDFVFIDADKDGYVGYLHAVLPLVRPGGVILGDNTLPDSVLTPEGDSGTKRYNSAVAAQPALVTTLVPVLRQRGLDGLTISVKLAE